MFLSNPFAGAFGLDIGDLSIKLLQLRPRRTLKGEYYYSIEDSRVIGLPPGYIVNGEIEQPEMVRKKLLRLLGRDGHEFKPIKAPWVVTDLPEPKTFLKLIEVDTPTEELTYDDIAYQAKKHLPYEMEETYLDWQIINPTNSTAKTSNVLIGAVPKITADSYTYLLESVDLQPLALEIEAVCISRAMITEKKDYAGEARAILDLGATRSSIIFYDYGSIQFSTTLNFSGELLTAAIAQNLKIDYETAEQIKIANGLNYDKARPKYLPTVTALTNNLISKIQKTLQFYKEHFPNSNPVTHITMCGGLAALANLDAELTNKLKIGAKPGNAWKNVLKGEATSEGKTRGLSLVSALGLAMRAASYHAP